MTCDVSPVAMFLFVSVLIHAMIQDQALVASKHYLVKTEDKNLADNAVDSPMHVGPPVDIGTKSGQTESGVETKNDKSLDGGDQHKVCKMNVRVVVK